MSKSILIIDTPTNCYECPCFMDMGWRYQCRLDIDEDVYDGRPEWCPLKEEVRAIPIKWIKKWIEDNPANHQVICMLDAYRNPKMDWRNEK